MDSCVTAAIASNDNDSMAFLHANYGQRTENRELQSFHDIADHYKVQEKLIIDMTHLNSIGGSCLTDENIAHHSKKHLTELKDQLLNAIQLKKNLKEFKHPD